jgi:hypothetical protein
MFISDERVPIADDQGNTVYIRSKMGRAVFNAVLGDAMQMEAGQKDAKMNIGEYLTSLLVHNIVAWEGPAFTDERGKPIPCTAENIGKLDVDEPLIDRVAEEIAQRNPRKQADPNSATAGSNGSKASGKSRRALTISK